MKKMQYKKIFIMLLSAIMVVTSIPFTATAATTNDDGYIEIRTIEELYNVRDDLTANYILMNDIDLKEATAEGGDWDFMGNGWNPIGSKDIYGSETFSGIFDGNGYAIKGMRINVDAVPSGASGPCYIGLFSEVSGTIRNLDMQDVNITTSKRSIKGAIAGSVINGGKIERCNVSGIINGKQSSGTIGYVGGLVGKNEGTIEECYNESNLAVSDARVGGIAGNNESTGIIENCYNVGNISNATWSGGIASYNYGKIVTSYNLGNVEYAVAYNSEGGKITNSYYLSGSGKGQTGATSLTETQIQLQSSYREFNFSEEWMLDINAVYPYPQLVSNISDARHISVAEIETLPNKTTYVKEEEIDLTGCVLKFQYTNAEEEYIDVKEEMITGFDKDRVGEQTITISTHWRTFDFIVLVEEKPFKEIHTVMELYDIRYDMNSNYILMNDIDLTEATTEGGDWDFDGRGWNPIGSKDIYGSETFSGIFDGNGYAIKGMRINVDAVPSGASGPCYIGLFSEVSGTIRNLDMQDVNITTSKRSIKGAIAGSVINGGKIERCNVSGIINGKQSSGTIGYVGGLVGKNEGTIEECYNESNLAVSDARVGGIAGNNESTGIIENCYNVGNISNATWSGGIASYNYGKIVTSYNLGNVEYAVAYNSEGGKITNSYYLSGSGKGATGATSLTETQIQTQSSYVGFDCINIWYLNTNANYPYLQLQKNAHDDRIIKKSEITTLPDKIIYTKGEEFDATGFVITFEYENADTEKIWITSDMVAGFISNKVGKQLLSVTCHRRTFTFEIVVNEKPFIEIHDAKDLYNVRQDLTANYILMNDIDLSEATAEGGAWDFDGRGWNPIGSKDIYGSETFSGIFDGNGYAIKGMRINVDAVPSGASGPCYIGLFSEVSGTIRNLDMQDVNITTSKRSIKGAIAGSVINGGKIERCNVSGIINGKQSSGTLGYVGGLVGKNEGTIEECYNESNLAVSDARVGGIAGNNESTGIIENCYNVGNISNATWSGGIASYNYGKIVTSYNLGNVEYAVAYNSEGGKITNSYYLSGSGKGATGATSLTETQLKLKAMYEGFDFDNVWVLNSHANYPYAQLRNNVQDLDETVELIRVIAYPIKTEYLTDDVIDPLGGMFEAVYISGKTELLEITADMISGYDPKAIGEQTLTVTYGGQTDTFTINVSRRPEVTSIELVSGPTQKEFVIGTAFDFSGAQIKVSYDNNTSEIIDVTNEMTSGGNINHISSQTITVKCGGQMVTFDVKVIPASISGIEITNLPSKLEYMEGEEFDATGMVVMATYSNGSTVQVKSGYKVTGYSSEPGIHKVTIEFAGQKATFDVTVNERVLLNLEIKAKPDKLNYVVGEELDLTGLLVVAAYENGDLDIIEDYTVFGLDGKAGSKVITITYKGKTASFVVNVAVKCVEKIEIIKMPTKLTYIENEALNVEGMIVKATYNDGEIKTVTDYKLEGYSSLPGVHTVYVSYEGQVDSFDVNVTEKVLSDLKVTIPTKTTYEIGEIFDATGMVVTAYYNNGQQYSVDNYVMSEFDSNSAGAKEIKITYEGMTRSFVVTVVEKTPIATGGKIEVGTGKGRLGETISVPVTITKNTGLSAFCHTITFDANDLAFKKVNLQGGFANGTVIINNEKVASGEITVLWFQANNVMESGVAYTLEFEVLETATDGISDITIAFDANENGNASGENVLFEAVNGSVEVLSYWLGDLNGDRKYAMADLLQLAQYVSGQTMTLNDKQKLSADVNEDGIIDIHDVTLLSQWLLEADM